MYLSITILQASTHDEVFTQTQMQMAIEALRLLRLHRVAIVMRNTLFGAKIPITYMHESKNYFLLIFIYVPVSLCFAKSYATDTIENLLAWHFESKLYICFYFFFLSLRIFVLCVNNNILTLCFYVRAK